MLFPRASQIDVVCNRGGLAIDALVGIEGDVRKAVVVHDGIAEVGMLRE